MEGRSEEIAMTVPVHHDRRIDPIPTGRPPRRGVRLTARLVAVPAALALTGAVLTSVAPPAAAATVVTELTDELNADGDCSLREAIEAVNTALPVDGCAFPADGVVELPAGEYFVNSTLTVGAPLTLRGPGIPHAAIDCSGVPAGNACLRSNGAGNPLTIEGMGVGDGNGPLILGEPASGPVRLRGAVLQGGTVGVQTSNNTIEVTDSFVTDADTVGVTSEFSDITVMRSAVAGHGSTGIATGSGDVVVDSSTVMSNGGFGVATDSGDVLVRTSTLLSNEWDAVRTTSGDLRYESTTVVSNRRALNIVGAGSATFQNTVLAEQDLQNCDNPTISDGHNVDDDGTCGFAAAGDQSGIDAQAIGLVPDAALPVVAFDRTGPVVDAGAACPAADQLGQPRPVDGDGDGAAVCDVGAYEHPGPIVDDGAGGAGADDDPSVSTGVTTGVATPGSARPADVVRAAPTFTG